MSLTKTHKDTQRGTKEHASQMQKFKNHAINSFLRPAPQLGAWRKAKAHRARRGQNESGSSFHEDAPIESQQCPHWTEHPKSISETCSIVPIPSPRAPKPNFLPARAPARAPPRAPKNESGSSFHEDAPIEPRK